MTENPLLASYLARKDEIEQDVCRVLSNGQYILGEEVKAFEKEFASYTGVTHGIGVASGTDALVIALKACGVGPGDEVITVSHTAVATVAAIEICGAKPVLVDIDSTTFTIDPDMIPSAITSDTKAILPVHLYGHPADLPQIRKICDQHNLLLIEDCAQAHGAEFRGQRVGSFGDLGAFSFYPTKNLGAFGDGGIIVTDNPQLAKRVSQIREYGWKTRYLSEIQGINSRLDEIQAAILRVKLPYLEGDNERRRGIAQRYYDGLDGMRLTLPNEKEGCRHVYHQFVIQTPKRDHLKSYLHEGGLSLGIHYPVPIHLQPAYITRLKGSNLLQRTERVCNTILSLPIHPFQHEETIDRTINDIRNFFEE